MHTNNRLSEFFSYQEMTISQTAARRGLRNTPTPGQIECLRDLAVNVLDAIRRLVGSVVIVSSGFRSFEVNRAIGGSADSQHMRGEAADIYAPRMSAQALFLLIKQSDIPVDQAILEFGWVHVSFTRRYTNRRDFLIASVRDGKTIYQRA